LFQKGSEGEQVSTESETDASELKGMRFRCLEGCGLCCLCQPEVLPWEIKSLKAPENGHLSIVRSSIDPSRKAIAMKGRGGACTMLEGRKCTIYERRPHFCRQFPVHLHLMSRAQFTADMSCRGIWEANADGEGEGLLPFALNENCRYPRQEEEAEREEAARIYREFRENAVQQDIWMEMRDMRREVALMIERGYFSDTGSLGGLLNACDAASESGQDILALYGMFPPDRQRALASMNEIGGELLGIEDAEDMPVYVDRKLNWNVFSGSIDSITRFTLLEDGGRKKEAAFGIDTGRIGISTSGREMLDFYAKVLNMRDIFMGFIYYLTDDADYTEKIINTYVQNLAYVQIDLIFRSALTNPDSLNNMGRNEIRDGIVFLDMDMQDAPTIGSII